ncbi:MAG: right-handed parallel beta-helix repeat-containing protein [Gammaproteobacteria bacterium]|nr:right-handed parallel beta-helix repeat-containing protein [Gammaproteobacteria bacterium]
MRSKVNLKGCFAIVVIFVVVLGIGRLSPAVSWKFTKTVDDSYDDNNSQKSGSNVVLDGYYGSDYEIFMAGFLPIIYVDADATGGANNGTNWENAYLYLQDALDDPCLVSGGEILVAAGTYRPDEDTANPGGSGDRRSAFHLKNGVTIKGGFAGFGEPNPDARDVELYKTILSGDLDGNDVQVSDPCDLQNEPTRAENSYHVVIGSGEDTTAVIDGFTITGGNANGSASQGSGGGMFNYNGNPTVTNCMLSGNSADSSGGGMYNYKSSPIVTNCTLTGNYAVSYGGSIYNNDNSSPTVTNCMFEDNKAGTGGGMYNRYDSNSTVIKCTFTGNSANSGAGMYNIFSRPNVTDCTFTGNSGSGMYNYDSNTIVTDCTFSENNALYGGGGMRNERGNPTVINCTFSGNSSGSHGGGMYNYLSSPTLINCTFNDNEAGNCGGGLFNMYESSPTVTDCAFTGNSASYGGGIYNQNDSNPEVISCTFNGNSAYYSGGGIRNDDNSNSIVINCTFVGNEARYGGGMYNPINCNPEVINCTFSGNSANSYGGGMCNYYNSPTVTNCIFWGNRPNEIYNSSSTPTITYSDIQGGYSGIGNIDADPCFVDVNNPNPNLWNLHLKSASACIDEGDNSAAGLAATDVDGHPRIIDGNCDGIDVVDMGAYEFNYAYMGDLDYNCRVDFFDFSLLAGFWQKQTIEQDYNYDGLVDFYDWAYFADFWDGDYYELSLFLDQWLTQTAAFVDIAPQSGDNIVDWQDLGKLCENWLVGVE